MTAPEAAAHHFSRRRFLAGSLAALALGGCATSSGERPGIIDTHTHFYDPTRPEGVPWPPKDDALLHRPVLPDEFKQLVAPFGVVGTVVVEASPRIDDNDWLLDLADSDPFIRGIVGHLKPGQPDFQEQLQRLANHPRFKGIRTGLWGVPVQTNSADIIRDLRRLGERDLALDVLVGPDQLPLVAQLAGHVPTTRLVVDHCANVRVRERSDRWTEGIQSAAQQPNVYMKVSGLVEGSGRPPAPVDLNFYRLVLDTIWDAFGEDRIIYGSNWPVSARFASYEQVLRIVYDYFKAKGYSAVRKYFWANATDVYRLEG